MELVTRETTLTLRFNFLGPGFTLSRLYSQKQDDKIHEFNSGITDIYVNMTFCSQLISQEPNQGVEYEFYLPNGRSREGYYWSYGSWSSCSRECGSGQTFRKQLIT